MPAFRDIRLGEVASVWYSRGPGFGFNVTSEYGGPLLSVTYRTAEAAEAARRAIEAALDIAVEVRTY